MRELPWCIRCDTDFESDTARRCPKCPVEVDLVATEALSSSSLFEKAQSHRPKTHWPFAIGMCAAMVLATMGILAAVTADGNANVAVYVFCILFAGIFVVAGIFAVRGFLRPRPPRPATVVAIAHRHIPTKHSYRTVTRVTLVYGAGDEVVLSAPNERPLNLDKDSIGARVIAFADHEHLYEVWVA